MSKIFEGTSITKRQPTISLDYLTAYDVGPISQGDLSEGPTVRVYRVFVENETEVYIEAELLDKTGWTGTPSLLFDASDSGNLSAIAEIDLTFDQLGRPFVFYQQPNGSVNDLWIWWFDSQLGDTTLKFISEGRNPNCYQDERSPKFSELSDILIFYINGDDSAVEWRQQRDRFDTIYTTPLTTGITDLFLEELSKTTDNRIRLVYLEFQPTLASYTLKFLDSALYPILLENEQLEVNTELLSGILNQVLQRASFNEQLEVNGTLSLGELQSVVLSYSLTPESLETSSDILSGELISIVLQTEIEPESVETDALILSGSLDEIVLQYNLDPESLETNSTLLSGTLTTV